MQRVVAIAFSVFFPLAAIAAEEPEAAYGRYHRAAASGDFEEMLRHTPAARRQEMAGASLAQRQAALKMANLMLPRAYKLLNKEVRPGGRSAQLILTGPAAVPGDNRLEPAYGTVRMVNENGEWKVDEVNWSNEKPAALAQKPAAPARKAAAPASPVPVVGSLSGAPERKFGKAKAPCVFKPVMTAEDMENCK